MAAVAPLGPLNGLEDAAGVPALGVRELVMLARTCRCCRKSASLSTMTPGVAELREAGVFGSDTGL